MACDDNERKLAEDADATADSLHQNESPTLKSMEQQSPSVPEINDPEYQRLVQQVQQAGRQPQPDSKSDGGRVASPSADSLDLPDLGHYKLLAKLGQGGMGAVYKALHTKLDKLVALKVLPADRLQDSAAVARFEREMRAVGKLTHENIVAAHDAGEINGTHYLVMELVDGADLGTIAREQAPLPVAEACEIIRQAALGLQHAHENNLVHRDIKPSNLMLAAGPGGPVIKILDMGLALLDEQHTEHPELTASGQIMGTLDYMAPEQAGDTHTVDIRADIYSLGATLYKLLTGRVPYEGPQYTSTVKKLMALATQDPPRIDSLRADLPAELVEVVHRMLARLPENRYDTPQQVVEAVAPWAAGGNLALLLKAGDTTQKDGVQTVLLHTSPKAASVSVRSSMVDTQPQVAPGHVRPPDVQLIGPSKPPRRFKRGVLMACAAMPVLLGVILLSLRTPHGEIVVELADGIPAEVAKNLKIEVTGNGQLKVADAAAGWTIDVAEGKYQARLAGGADQFQLEQNQVTVIRGEKTLLKVTLKPLGEAPSREQHAGTAPAPKPKAAKIWQPTPEQQAFFDHVATLPPEEQAKAVAEKLKEVNPGFDGTTEHKVEGGQVVAFTCHSEHLVDIWPVRALRHLKQLGVGGVNSKRIAKLADLSPLRGLSLRQLTVFNSLVDDLTPLAGMPLEELNCEDTRVKDLSPLKGMPLKYLLCGRTLINDLSPLEGMSLDFLRCDLTGVADVSPLRGMKLADVNIYRTNVTDLSPLAGMPLRKLFCDVRLFNEDDQALIRSLPLTHLNGAFAAPAPVWETLAEHARRRRAALEFAEATAKLPPSEQVEAVVAKLNELNGAGAVNLRVQPFKDAVEEVALVLNDKRSLPLNITPLMAFTQLKKLKIYGGLPYRDISCVKFLPLEELHCDDGILFKNVGVLKKMPSLKLVNGQPASEYLVRVARERLNRFANRSQLTGKWQATPEQQAFFDHVATLSADEQAKAVAEKLKEVNPGFDGTTEHKVEDGQVVYFRCRSEHLADIWPIRALSHLKQLQCGGGSGGGRAKFDDLSPLQGLPLEYLHFHYSSVSDLSPIQGMPLKQLGMHNTLISDLTALTGMQLEEINFEDTQINDLTPLKGMPLKWLHCGRTLVQDLSPVQGMPLTVFRCDRTAIADISPLQGMKLTEANIYRTNVTDLSPLAGMPLRKLFCDVRLFDDDDFTLIRSLPLIRLNGTIVAPAPVEKTLAEIAARRQAAQAFAETTSKLPPSEQVEAVTAKLNELNGVGVVSLRVQPFKNAVEEVVLVLHDNLYQSLDITPLMAFTQLKKLKIFGGLPYRDISCLQFLPLEELQCNDRILFKNLASLKKMETLKRVNGQPAKEYLDFVARDGFNHFANLKSPDPEKN